MNVGRAMLIAGAGEAGTAAALTLRQEGWAGPVLLVSDETLWPYQRPPLSKSTLIESDDLAPKPIVSKEQLADANITALSGRAVCSIDRKVHRVRLSSGETVAYDRLLLAAGARPRTLGWPAHPRIKTLRTHADALGIRENIRRGAVVAVVGGGFIGLEVAASAASLGASAIVLEAGPQILMRAVPGNMATIIRREHEAAGVRIETGVRPAAVRTVGNDVHLVLSNKRTLAANLVVIGIGATPNSDLAAQAGLRIDNGIAVDETLATSDPDIFAAGDCCSFPHALYAGRRLRLEAWRNARRQGTHAAANMLGATEAYCDVPWFWSDQYDKTLQVAGICNPEDRIIQRCLGESAQASVHLDSEGRLVAACAFGRLDAVAKEIRFAEKAIAKRVKPDIALISQPDFSFRLLR